MIKSNIENTKSVEMRNNVFLTDTELKRLTGFKDRKKQAEWLEENGFPVLLSGKGVPILTQRVIESCFARTFDFA